MIPSCSLELYTMKTLTTLQRSCGRGHCSGDCALVPTYVVDGVVMSRLQISVLKHVVVTFALTLSFSVPGRSLGAP